MNAFADQEVYFPAGIRINTYNGLVPIQNIQIGDMVLTKSDHGNQEACYKPVVRTASCENKDVWELWYFAIPADTDISKLRKGKLLQLSRKGKLSGTAITENCLFRVKESGWIRADELKNGQVIETMNPDVVALVFMIHPLRETTMPNVAGSYHVRNVFDANKKGFDIEDVDYFDLFEYNETGLCAIPAQDVPSPLKVNG